MTEEEPLVEAWEDDFYEDDEEEENTPDTSWDRLKREFYWWSCERRRDIARVWKRFALAVYEWIWP